MAGRCAGKLALVTGAAQGLGRAHATRLAEEGARVLCTDINGDGAAETAKLIDDALGAGTAFSIAHDVTDPQAWEAAVDAARDKLGGLNVLVNNAGIGVGGNIETCDFDDWKRCFAINVDSIFHGCQKAPPLMREHRLYQSDWLMRFYGFQPQEVVAAADATTGMLPLDIDPKLAWALKFRDRFPVDVNRAPRELLWRIPGLGTKAVARILSARRWRRLRLDDIARLTVSVAKVRPFIVTEDWRPVLLADRGDISALVAPKAATRQLELFAA